MPYAISLLPNGALYFCTTISLITTHASPGWFPFFSVTNITKLERLHRAASRSINGSLSSSPIPLLHSEVSHVYLKVTLTYFASSFYERAHRPSTSFSISGLARLRLGVKPRLSRYFWRTFLLTTPLMHLPAYSREVFFACPYSFPRNPHSVTIELTLFFSCFRSEPSIFPQVKVLAHLDSFLPHDLAICIEGSLSLSFGKDDSGLLANFSLSGTETTIYFSEDLVSSSFSAEACAIIYALPAAPASFPFLFAFSLFRFSLSNRHYVISSVFLFTSNPLAYLAETVFSFLLYYQTTMGNRVLLFPGNDAADGLAWLEAILLPFEISRSISPLTFRIHFSFFLNWRPNVSSKFFVSHLNTGFLCF